VRGDLPVREFYNCRDCGYGKVVNPLYHEQVNRDRTLQTAIALAGLLHPSGVFTIASRLMNLRGPSTRFRCAKCEGMQADISLATICPQCHTITTQPVLRTCNQPDCGYNYVKRIGQRSLWTTSETGGSHDESAPAAAPISHAIPHPVEETKRLQTALSSPTMPRVPTSADPSLAEFKPCLRGPVPATAGAGERRIMQMSIRDEAPAAHELVSAAPAGWYPDPSGRHAWRWFERRWTSWTSDNGAISKDITI
jgi:hypothetical protein